MYGMDKNRPNFAGFRINHQKTAMALVFNHIMQCPDRKTPSKSSVKSDIERSDCPELSIHAVIQDRQDIWRRVDVHLLCRQVGPWSASLVNWFHRKTLAQELFENHRSSKWCLCAAHIHSKGVLTAWAMKMLKKKCDRDVDCQDTALLCQSAISSKIVTQKILPHRFGGEGVLIGVQTATLNAQMLKSHLLMSLYQL